MGHIPSTRRRAYSDKELPRVPCVKCGAPSSRQWRICASGGWTAVCGACDVAINALVATWAFGQDVGGVLVDRYKRSMV